MAGGPLKEIGFVHWGSPNSGATNAVGFNGVGSGVRNYLGLYSFITYSADLWNSNTDGFHDARVLSSADSSFGHSGNTNYKEGKTVRLIKDDSTDPGTMTDSSGNVYMTVKIGTQVWMASNLKTRKYRDGSSISEVTDASIWAGLTSGALCAYSNNWAYV